MASAAMRELHCTCPSHVQTGIRWVRRLRRCTRLSKPHRRAETGRKFEPWTLRWVLFPSITCLGLHIEEVNWLNVLQLHHSDVGGHHARKTTCITGCQIHTTDAHGTRRDFTANLQVRDADRPRPLPDTFEATPEAQELKTDQLTLTCLHNRWQKKMVLNQFKLNFPARSHMSSCP